MPTVPLPSPATPGKCNTPQVLSATEQPFQFSAPGPAVSGSGFIALACDVAWLYSDSPGSGRQMLIAPAAQLVLPLVDDMTIGARTVTGAGVLYSMILEDFAP